MYHRKLHKTVEKISSQLYANEEEMLISVLNELIQDDNNAISGGRIWKLSPEKKAYGLVYQNGNIDHINEDFLIPLKDYPLFELFIKERTIFGHETNHVLREKGIFKYAASAVGNRTKIDGLAYYEYLLAVNSTDLTSEFKYSLNIIATVLTSKIKQWRTASSQKSLKADINRARELQKSILPQHEFNYYDYEVYGATIPAEIIGGDFFDYLEIGEDKDRLGIVLGDAASKGISAAAEAMYISGALRMATSFEIKISTMMKRMNRLVNQIFSDDRFSSLFYGELTRDKNGLFIYSNAGHNPPIFLREGKDEVQFLDPTGPVLGPAPKAVYTTENINFQKGDILLIYSDGITEAADIHYDFYGEEKIIELLLKKRKLSPREIALSLVEDVILFEKDGQYSDDKTVVVIKKIK
ncbi:MAG: PP2C family protein-serine/threonine phosphatase [Ignavibacteria bacterium]|jgi:sigma-B regulation protein RsbU (phosphoserine phosphatase)|nr:PP2C family protein-serine/threonine phosphatase [Ignavibacteria bacterium]